MKDIVLFVVLLLVVSDLKAQHQELQDKPDLWRGKQHYTDDSNTMLYDFKKGSIHGHARYFFMATDNAPGLTDYYANAAGGGIKYETAKYKGFQFGVSGFFVFNIGSSNLALIDENSRQPNRYEVGLFDISDPANKYDIDRLEEFYIKYSYRNSHIVFGKQLINTPFINLQDGRMRPTEVGGLWAEYNELKNLKIEGGYLYEISPRSTVKWYDVAQSIGVFQAGVNPDGSKSGYAGNLQSGGIGILGIDYVYANRLKLKVHNLYVDNIMNTALLQAEYRVPIASNTNISTAVQYIRQDAVNDGGNPDISKAYFTPGATSHSFGARLLLEKKDWQLSFNYNRITADARYLMPREWGRDPFFTFLPRERNEGFGDVHAYMAKALYKIRNTGLRTQLAAGYYYLPDVTNYRLNKYGMPSYYQINAELKYAFKGLLAGWETQLLYLYKVNASNEQLKDKYIINKVDMGLWNLVVNFHF